MRLIFLESTDPHYNLASEEYLLRHSSEDCFILWRNNNAVIVGRNQNTLAEINYEAVKEKEISVVRRMSGGGAVFHDLGNLNYTFIMQNDGNDFNNFAKFCEPIIHALKSLEVNACLSGRNDLLIEDKKFSGNAQYVYKNKILHHGCLLFSTDMSRLGEVLKVNSKKLQSKGIQSVRSRVTNIKDHLKRDMDVIAFKDFLMLRVMNEFPDAKNCNLTDDEIVGIQALCDSKYSTWDWNFGYSPRYTLKQEHYLPVGSIEINLEIEDGLITAIRIFGDYFGRRDISELEDCFIGIRHQESDIERVLDNINMPLNEYVMGITDKEFTACFF